MKTAAIVLTALTLNVGGPRRVLQGWQTRLEALSAHLATEHVDAGAFQEVWRAEDVQALATAAGHPYQAQEPSLGLAVTSRRPIAGHTALDLGGGSGILRADIDINGKHADVYTARINPGESPNTARRLGQLLAAAEFVRAQSGDRPLVLLGDLAVSSDDKSAEIFLDLLGARDLCVSHGDEMCGRTIDDRRVDFALIPYSSRPPLETARTAFTQTLEVDGEVRPLSTHFGLTTQLDEAWLKLRLSPEPEGRAEALGIAANLFDAARAEAEDRVHLQGWIPWRGAIMASRARDEAARYAADAERARSALARAAKPSTAAYE